MSEVKQAATQALALNKGETRHTRTTMILLAIVLVGTMVATHAPAAERGASGAYGSGSARYPSGLEFQGPVNTAPAVPTSPTFNPSEQYIVPQSPEVPVSPGSPGSVFGDH
jgi:hypothetical protein